MTGLLAIPLLIGAAWGLVTRFRIGWEQALPITVLGITAGLYPFYLAGVLYLGWWIAVLACLASALYGALKHRHEWRTPRVPATLAAWLVAVIWVCFLVRNRHVAGHDELRLWGAYPKLLFFDGGLQVGPDTLLIGEMPTYLPGMPLFSFFVARTDLHFADTSLFLAYGLFTTALLTPLARKASWSRPATIVGLGTAIALLPLAYANAATEGGADFYASLFVDPIVGLMLGYVCWLVAQPLDRPLLWAGHLGLAVASMHLVKSTGLLLGAVVLAVACGRWFLASRGTSSARQRLSVVALLVLPLAATGISWRVVQQMLGPETKFDTGSWSGGVELGLARTYLNIILGRPEFSAGYGFFWGYTSFAVLNAALLTAIACVAVLERRRRRSIGLSLAVLVVSQSIFMIGIYLLVVGPFGGTFQSYPRYTMTMLTAASVVLALVLTEGWPRSRTPRDRVVGVALSGCLVFLAACYPMRMPMTFIGGWEEQARADITHVRQAIRSESLEDDPRPVIALTFREDWLNHVGHHHSVHYDLLDIGARVWLFSQPAFVVPPGMTEKKFYAKATRAFTANLASEGVDLLVVSEDMPELAMLDGVFPTPPETGSVWAVESNGGEDLRLRRVQ